MLNLLMGKKVLFQLQNTNVMISQKKMARTCLLIWKKIDSQLMNLKYGKSKKLKNEYEENQRGQINRLRD